MVKHGWGPNRQKLCSQPENFIIKPNNSKIVDLEKDIFDCEGVKHVVQFTKSLKHTANYFKLDYNIEVMEAIRLMVKQVFTLPEKLVAILMKCTKGMEVPAKPDETDI